MFLNIPFSLLSDFLPSLNCLGLSLCKAQKAPQGTSPLALFWLFPLLTPSSPYYNQLCLSGFFSVFFPSPGPLLGFFMTKAGQGIASASTCASPHFPGCVKQAWVPASLGQDSPGMEVLGGEQGRAPTNLKSTFV